jgi:hypothetical protein
MKRIKLEDMTVDQLVERFVEIALAESDALKMGQTGKYNRLFDRMIEVMGEFLVRPIEQRHALMALYTHPDPQVRYTAAFITKDIAPEEVREVCEILIAEKRQPQAANASIMIDNMNEGPPDYSWILERRSKAH